MTSWQPILDGALAEEAAAAVEALAEALPSSPIPVAPEAAATADESFYTVWNASLASGAAGQALFYTYLALHQGGLAESPSADLALDLLDRATDAVAAAPMGHSPDERLHRHRLGQRAPRGAPLRAHRGGGQRDRRPRAPAGARAAAAGRALRPRQRSRGDGGLRPRGSAAGGGRPGPRAGDRAPRRARPGISTVEPEWDRLLLVSARHRSSSSRN